MLCEIKGVGPHVKVPFPNFSEQWRKAPSELPFPSPQQIELDQDPALF
jgi:hypothetical protein